MTVFLCYDSGMAISALNISIHRSAKGKRVRVEFDRDRFERLAAGLGFFCPEFLKSIERAEREVSAGRARQLRSLRDLRRS